MVHALHDARPDAAQGGDTARTSDLPDQDVATVMQMRLRVGLFGLLLLLSTMRLGAGEQLSMKLSTSVAFAPANLVVRAMVEADAQNRAVEVVAESEDFYRSSQIPLDGGNAPRITMFELRSLPPGRYEVKATLFGSGGEKRAMVRQSMNVIASGARDR